MLPQPIYWTNKRRRATCYSSRNTAIGSTREARRAGRYAANTAIANSTGVIDADRAGLGAFDSVDACNLAVLVRDNYVLGGAPCWRRLLRLKLQLSESCEIEAGFHAAYQDLEGRMKALAEADGDIFLPNPEPFGPVHYFLICMEPSLGHWASTSDHARARVEAGFRNFLSSIEDFILHFCVRRYLCESEQRYHITDISKGAMHVNGAGHGRSQRYDRWYGLLLEELELCATANAGIIAVGNVVFHYLKERGFQRPLDKVIHYSSQAGRARNKASQVSKMPSKRSEVRSA